MRLLIVSQYFWPENFRINDLAEGMRSRGHEVTVLTGLPNYPDGKVFDAYRRDPAAYSDYHGVEIIRVPNLPRGLNAFTLALNYASFALSGLLLGPWKLRGRTFDAIFVFQISPITAALPALLLRRTKRVPLLLWVLDLWPETLSAIGVVKSPWLLALVGGLVRFVYRRCDRILVQSRAFIDNVRRYAGGDENVRYFPNWIEPTFAEGLDGVASAPELAPYRDAFNVMFAGNVGEAQDLPAVLDAAEAARDLERLRWLIVGDGRAMGQLKSEIARRDLAAHVILLGRHPVERMPAFFAGADALLVSLKADPIWSSTIPGKVQNYLAAGLPVLGMLDGEGARVIEHFGGGLVSPAGDGAALAANVRRLMTMSIDERATMGQAGRARAQEDFARDRLFNSLETWAAEAEAEFRGRRTRQPRRDSARP